MNSRPGLQAAKLHGGVSRRGHQAKARKANSGKASKKKDEQPPASASQGLEYLPIESYRLSQGEGDLFTEYVLAVYALFREWAEHRFQLQGLWRDVAYKSLNSAVAGAVSNIAINMVERSAAAIFVEFPGYDSYETVMETVTRGDLASVQGLFRISLHRLGQDKTAQETVLDKAIDIEEHCMMLAYRDLVDFVMDFQKNRTGRPTKRMLKEIGDWNPLLDLAQASKAGRLQWRRSYTINWLYDLVNVYSSTVVRRNTAPGQPQVLESMDWSSGSTGPWTKNGRLWGLNQFAGHVTHLAMQKPGSDIRRKILVHHVFQLQCVVDSFTCSRGWLHSFFDGAVLGAPPSDFRPRRDVDMFLDQDHRGPG